MNAIGTLNLLEVVRRNCPSAKFYQANSSVQFGNSVNDNEFQDEKTPVRPYGCSKVFVKHYRHAYGIFACSEILHNHESQRRGMNFVTRKVVEGAVKIEKGVTTVLELGNLDSSRDWGHFKDYARAMHVILQHSKPDDFVVATGETHTVRDFAQVRF